MKEYSPPEEDYEDDDGDGDEEHAEKVTITPAARWPVYEVDHARAELIALDLLTRGASEYRVKQMTRLSRHHIRRLAKVVAEEAKNPKPPRLVCRRQAPRPAPEPPAEEPEQLGLPFD